MVVPGLRQGLSGNMYAFGLKARNHHLTILPIWRMDRPFCFQQIVGAALIQAKSSHLLAVRNAHPAILVKPLASFTNRFHFLFSFRLVILRSILQLYSYRIDYCFKKPD